MILIEESISLLTNTLVNIMDFDRGDQIYRAGFKCNICGARLIARKGTINAHHFASIENHSEDCVYSVSGFLNANTSMKIRIELPEFRSPSNVIPTHQSNSSGSGVTIETSSTVTTLEKICELDEMLMLGSITRRDLTGISGRNWENFFITELSYRLILKIEDYNDRGSNVPYVFKGEVKKVWNHYLKGAFLYIKGKYINGKYTSVMVRIPNSSFNEDTIALWNEENFQVAVLGVPIIEEDETFRTILIDVPREKLEQRIYEYA